MHGSHVRANKRRRSQRSRRWICVCERRERRGACLRGVSAVSSPRTLSLVSLYRAAENTPWDIYGRAPVVIAVAGRSPSLTLTLGVDGGGQEAVIHRRSTQVRLREGDSDDACMYT